MALDYAGRDQRPDLVRPDQAGEDAELLVSVVAHVERGGAGGKADVARYTLEVAAPMSADRGQVLLRRIQRRLVRAAQLATQNALGQLWARDQGLSALREAAAGAKSWRRAAALLELGERADKDSVEVLEEAAISSDAGIAQVACAALGRLGLPRSVAPLARQVRGARSSEVVDAALYGLNDIGGEQAAEVLRWASRSHPSRWIRLRARALLDAMGAGAKAGQK